MPEKVKLNFPPYHFRVTTADKTGEMKIWDELRGHYLVLTPEEWVRQHLIKFLIESCDAPAGLISQEHLVKIQGMPQRADVVVYGVNRKPLLIAECKAPSVKIDQSVYAQAVRYNAIVGARYLLITNGMKHYIYEKDEQGYTPLNSFPMLGNKS